MSILLALILILITSSLFGALVERCGIPSVVGQLVAGIFLGPAVLNWLQINHTLEIFAEIGVILLMFIAGLESNLTLLKKYLTPAVMVGISGVIVPLVCFYLLGLFGLALSPLAAIFLGLIFSATSVSISAAVLSARKKLDTVAGSVILGAAVVDDIIVIMLLSLLTSFASGGKLDFASPQFWWEFIGLKIVFFIGCYAIWKLISSKFTPVFAKIKHPFKVALVPLVLCLIGAYFAVLTGMSDVIGAFLLGMILSTQKDQLPMLHATESIAHSLFIPVFFVMIGLKLNLDGIVQHWQVLMMLTVLAFLTKVFGSYLASRSTKLGKNDATLISIGMISRGEMALIIIEIGRHLNLLPNSLLDVIILVIILTTIFSPLILNKFLDYTEA